MTTPAPTRRELEPPAATQTFYARYGKRAMDVVLSAGALLVFSPVIAGLSVAVAARHGRPVLFRQRRAGLHGRAFDIVKFRTMTDERDATGAPLPDSVRLTSFGRFLRKSSLDELPELFGVLRGDMSLVGPRPLLHHYVDRYTPRQALRHHVRPGITGWAAVNGRNTTSWAERFELDVHYVENVSLRLDLEILFKTVWTVLRPGDVDPGWADTMPEFQGDAEPQAHA